MTEYRKTCNNSLKNMKHVHECVIKLFDKNEFCNFAEFRVHECVKSFILVSFRFLIIKYIYIILT